MSLKLLLDEDYRDSALWEEIRKHNDLSDEPIDVVRVGDEDGPPLSSSDDDVLEWAEQQGRILISYDVNTLPGHLEEHLAQGRSSPGIIFMPHTWSVHDVIEYFVLVCHATDEHEWSNTWRWAE